MAERYGNDVQDATTTAAEFRPVLGEETVSLVVLHGDRKGARFVLHDHEYVVGRAAGVDVRLADPRVSRRHARITLRGRKVRFECLAGASSILIDGLELRDGLAEAGQQVVVGETILGVELSTAAVESTDIEVLLSGAAADVRGLSALVALTEALDAAEGRNDLASILSVWGARYLSSSEVRLVESDGRDRIEVRTAQGRSSALVPTQGDRRTAMEFDFFSSDSGISAGVLRLLAVAGRVCGSALARLDALADVHRDKEVLRELAVGTARAFLGNSAAAEMVTKLVARLAASSVPALLEGETGVGKTFVARLVHESGERGRSPLRVVNCAAIPENLVESELFGHERGAFTGAASLRSGVFESAGQGTVLLDEIGELPLASQSKLLHVLDDKIFSRVGSNRSIPLRARILAATNRNLNEMVASGQFRSDLFFRLSVVRVHIPPLRERGEDLALLARHLLTDLCATSSRRVDGFTDEALEIIRRYPWPGNVRELRNVLEHALVLGDGARISATDLPEPVRAGAGAAQPATYELASTGPSPAPRRVVELPASLDWLEKQAIEAALAATNGNRTQAAAILQINRVTLYKKLRAARPT